MILSMNQTKYLLGPCGACGAMIRFPAQSIGSISKCPYCGKQTELSLAAPKQEPAVSRRAITYGIIAIVILVLGLVGAFIALNRAREWAARNRTQPAAIDSNTNTTPAQ